MFRDVNDSDWAGMGIELEGVKLEKKMMDWFNGISELSLGSIDCQWQIQVAANK